MNPAGLLAAIFFQRFQFYRIRQGWKQTLFNQSFCFSASGCLGASTRKTFFLTILQRKMFLKTGNGGGSSSSKESVYYQNYSEVIGKYLGKAPKSSCVYVCTCSPMKDGD